MPLFEDPGFQAAEWLQFEACQQPFLAYRSDVRRFLQALCDHHWILPNPDSVARLESPRRTPAAWQAHLSTASSEDLRRLLTAHVQQDGVCEGHLAEVFASGEMLAILKRLKQIAAKVPLTKEDESCTVRFISTECVEPSP